ncbi:phosphoadenosine phosphosulfate reductase family protein [Haloferax sp. MBLA0076]|uniref:Phosphoadenosine phosphosulfate reductase family protein n=1 Tax=Haloferax litoreum TaxID=2666140 RepID=A0A6A8GJ61_9EURY|nr:MULTISPECIES: phosphoadenosine phosphosulfate reductase family protein [Haloferax]KAB1194698.1 phosphoadenosine phosphosulfate reductase family protein [Haloferax sp. CBA1148]MRX23278.1 phosphoadenosine phosphosulfate reductase family protein [Haloferax litoreum]
MVLRFPDYLSLDYSEGRDETAAAYPTLEDKLEKAASITRTALEQYERPAIMWTGGKDSTVVLYVVREVAADLGVAVPPVVFIDHFEHFDETEQFVYDWADRWDLDLIVARNEDFAGRGMAPGDEIAVSDLRDETQRELARLGYDDDTIVLDADTFEGNHLLKTVALNDVITEHGFDGIFSGVRWDEQEARADETFFSPRHESDKYPPHDRVHTILQFTEADIWGAFWNYVVPDAVDGYPVGHVPQSYDDLPEGVEPTDLPVSPKYFEGYRSLGTESGSTKADDRPAWVQDLAASKEREGRAQDKENLMARLRDLGYM